MNEEVPSTPHDDAPTLVMIGAFSAGEMVSLQAMDQITLLHKFGGGSLSSAFASSSF